MVVGPDCPWWDYYFANVADHSLNPNHGLAATTLYKWLRMLEVQSFAAGEDAAAEGDYHTRQILQIVLEYFHL